MAQAFHLAFSIEGDKQLSRRLTGLKHTLEDWRPAFEKTAKYMQDTFSNDVFSSNGGVVGEPWKPLSPAYLKAKRAAGYPADILVRTGEMKRSFKTLFSPSSAEIWNTSSYFKYHQSNKPRKVLPRRVMMRLADKQREAIVKIFHEYYIKSIKSI